MAKIEPVADPTAQHADVIARSFLRLHPRLRRDEVTVSREHDQWIITESGGTHYRAMLINAERAVIIEIDPRNHGVDLGRVDEVALAFPVPPPVAGGFDPLATARRLRKLWEETLPDLDKFLSDVLRGISLDRAAVITALRLPPAPTDSAGRPVDHTDTLTAKARNDVLGAVDALARFTATIAEAQGLTTDLLPVIRAAVIAAEAADAHGDVLPLSRREFSSKHRKTLDACEEERAKVQRVAADMAIQRDLYLPRVRVLVLAFLTIAREARLAHVRPRLDALRAEALRLRADTQAEILTVDACTRLDPTLLADVPSFIWPGDPLAAPRLSHQL